jgi:hypothetical protein
MVTFASQLELDDCTDASGAGPCDGFGIDDAEEKCRMSAEIERCPERSCPFARGARFRGVTSVEYENRTPRRLHGPMDRVFDARRKGRDSSERGSHGVCELDGWSFLSWSRAIGHDDEAGASEIDIGIGETSEDSGEENACCLFPIGQELGQRIERWSIGPLHCER